MVGCGSACGGVDGKEGEGGGWMYAGGRCGGVSTVYRGVVAI